MDISVSGTKEQAKLQVVTQVDIDAVADAITALIDAMPGDQVSISGSISSTATGKAGSFTISGSSWTT